MRPILKAAVLLCIIMTVCCLLITGALAEDTDTIEVENAVLAYTLDTDNKTAEVTIQSVSESGPVTIPDAIKVNGVSYSVTSVGIKGFAENVKYVSPSTDFEDAQEIAGKITSLTVPNTVRAVPGNLFDWSQEQSGVKPDCIKLSSFTIYPPDTENTLAAIPAFISGNYKSGAYSPGSAL